MLSRSETVRRLKQETFDILIIGGGATGTGVALDAALRGLKVALIEAGDFASGSSSVSTKLIHGGVRYLEKAFKDLDIGQFSLVVEALHEREHMLKIAPHLSHEQGIIIPIFSKTELLYYGFGLKIYDSLSGETQVRKSRLLEKDQVLSLMPELKDEKLMGGVLYFDGQFDDALYNITLARSAQKKGAIPINYVKCMGFEKNESGRIITCLAHDVLNSDTFKIRTKFIINCTGPYSDVIRDLAHPGIPKRLRPSRGIHILLDRDFLSGKQGFLIPKTQDGRVIFALPWYQSVLVGTTETEVTDLSEGNNYSLDEVRYLLEYLQEYLSVTVQMSDIKGIISGMRPLVTSIDSQENTESLIRSHEVEKWKSEGMISVLGGKWTTYRKMAEDAIDAYYEIMDKEKVPSKTRDYMLLGAPEQDEWDQASEKMSNLNIPDDIIDHLKNYGTEATEILTCFENNGIHRLHPHYPYTTCEVRYALSELYAQNMEDILSRRTRLELFDLDAALEAAPIVANVMGKFFKWNEGKRREKLEDYSQYLANKEKLFKQP